MEKKFSLDKRKVALNGWIQSMVMTNCGFHLVRININNSSPVDILYSLMDVDILNILLKWMKSKLSEIRNKYRNFKS